MAGGFFLSEESGTWQHESYCDCCFFLYRSLCPSAGCEWPVSATPAASRRHDRNETAPRSSGRREDHTRRITGNRRNPAGPASSSTRDACVQGAGEGIIGRADSAGPASSSTRDACVQDTGEGIIGRGGPAGPASSSTRDACVQDTGEGIIGRGDPAGPAPGSIRHDSARSTAGSAPMTPPGLPPVPSATTPSGLPPVPGIAPAAKASAPPAKPAAESPAGPAVAKLPPPKGSRLPVDKISCVTCHTDPGIWDEKTKHLFHSREKLAADIHFQKGVNCQDCHGGNYESDDVKAAHAQEDGFRAKAEEIRKYCVVCHKDNAIKLTMGVHAKAGDKDERGAGTRLACEKCHGNVSHQTLTVRDKQSPVYSTNQVKTCGGCHPEQLETYYQGVHAHAGFELTDRSLVELRAENVPDEVLSKLEPLKGTAFTARDAFVRELTAVLSSDDQQTYEGPILNRAGMTAGCADCHGSHGIYDASDRRSTLHPTRVAATCGKCHHDIEEKLQASVHASAGGPGGIAQRSAPGANFSGNGNRKPSCTDCHQGHDQPNPHTVAFREQLPYRCGNCHNNLSSTYGMSIHGELTELGYGPAAKCSDCHGSHEILAVSNPKSLLATENRVQTCRKCHPSASSNFANFDPHADHLDASRGGIIRWTYLFFLTMLIATFGCFGVHSVLWFVRSLVDVLKHGRPKGLRTGRAAYVRFTAPHRWGHALLLVSFLGLAATGLPLKYSHSEWGKNLAAGLGGFSSTGNWHRFFALTTFACLAMYVGLLARRYYVGRRGALGGAMSCSAPIPRYPPRATRRTSSG